MLRGERKAVGPMKPAARSTARAQRGVAGSAPEMPLVLNLQRLLGNQGGVRLVQPTPDTPVPIQRARLNLRADGTISGVSDWPDRPTSNLRGTQGQHLTAYVAFQDAILSHVKDVTVPEAAAALRALLVELRALPGMGLQSANYLQAPIDANLALLRDHAADTGVVGGVVDNILSIRNKVPGTAERGTGGGHGEAGHSGMLETVETALRRDDWKAAWDEDIVGDQCRYSMWRLLDYDPPRPADDEAAETIGQRVLTHFLSLRMAYPQTFAWLTARESYLFTYLEAHRAGPELPLKQLTALQFNALRDYVHGHL